MANSGIAKIGQMESNRWIKCIATDGNIRGVAIQATDLVQQIADLHGQTGLTTQGLGEAIVAGLLLGSYIKQGERTNLNIQGTGRFRQALVDAYPDGRVRAYVVENAVASPDAPGLWGEGTLSVLKTRDEEGGKEPYIGTVPLLTGHLAKDLSFYWVQSEQVPSAIGIAVHMDENGRVASAGGFLVQAMPGASTEELNLIEVQINQIENLASDFSKESDPHGILYRLFQDISFMVVEERTLKFECTCSKDRVERALLLVGMNELQVILDEDKKAEVRCDFCSQKYVFNSSDLEILIRRTQSGDSAKKTDLH